MSKHLRNWTEWNNARFTSEEKRENARLALAEDNVFCPHCGALAFCGWDSGKCLVKHRNPVGREKAYQARMEPQELDFG